MNNTILFACDLDNTLLHSHRKSSEGDICAELLDGREQSFLTPLACQLIGELTANERVLLLPVTTRSIAQYKRIQWPDGCTPQYALVCNGSILLKNGTPECDWYARSEEMTAPYEDELQRLCEMYSGREQFKTVRIVDDMFLFVYCRNREEIEQIAQECMKDTALDVAYSGSKMYFFPPAANKGYAVNRFREYYGAEKVIAAGDSSIDISMLAAAQTALIPDESLAEVLHHENLLVCSKEEHFSEFILRSVKAAAALQ